MNALVFIPTLTFVLLFLGEWWFPRRAPHPRHRSWDWIIHFSGFLVQGAVIPLCGYLAATWLLPAWLPGGQAQLAIGWWGAFLLNFVLVDFLYYWQHRWFHRISWLWKWHLCHHSAQRVDIWITSRNSLLLHFLFVYFLLNPILGYLVDRPDGFFAGAMLTASLDIFRHSNIDGSAIPGGQALSRKLGKWFVLPSTHHRHHGASDHDGNFGANLILWDRWFGTYLEKESYPDRYGVDGAPSLPVQWLRPWKNEPNKETHAS